MVPLWHRQVAGDHPQQRGLAGAVRADQRDLRALADPERHVGEELPPVRQHECRPRRHPHNPRRASSPIDGGRGQSVFRVTRSTRNPFWLAVRATCQPSATSQVCSESPPRCRLITSQADAVRGQPGQPALQQRVQLGLAHVGRRVAPDLGERHVGRAPRRAPRRHPVGEPSARALLAVSSRARALTSTAYTVAAGAAAGEHARDRAVSAAEVEQGAGGRGGGQVAPCAAVRRCRGRAARRRTPRPRRPGRRRARPTANSMRLARGRRGGLGAEVMVGGHPAILPQPANATNRAGRGCRTVCAFIDHRALLPWPHAWPAPRSAHRASPGGGLRC